MAGLRRLYFFMPEQGKFTYVINHMRIKVPGKTVYARLFERVETVDNQYDIFDVGIEQEDGSVDSIVFGGSFSYAKSLCRKADEKADAKKQTVTVSSDAETAAA